MGDSSKQRLPKRVAGALAFAGLVGSLPLPKGAEGLPRAVADRFREIVPPGEFEVDVDGEHVVVRAIPPARGAGSVMHGLARLELKLPLPASLRLRLFFEAEARSLQEFVSKTSRRNWPAPNATPHVRVDPDWVHVWYGPADEEHAVLRWRPFDRTELGL
jgi:hypothetical protein